MGELGDGARLAPRRVGHAGVQRRDAFLECAVARVEHRKSATGSSNSVRRRCEPGGRVRDEPSRGVDTDLREVLPAVRVPTIVFYREGQYYESYALDVAKRIPSARAQRVSGSDRWGIFLSPELPGEVERFVHRRGRAGNSRHVLATLMFTDIVGSTERSAALGDHAWRECSTGTTASCGAAARFAAREGHRRDGFFATFDGPARAIRCAHAVVDGVRELGSRFARASTRASASCTRARLPGSPSRSARALRLWRAGGGARLADREGSRRGLRPRFDERGDTS